MARSLTAPKRFAIAVSFPGEHRRFLRNVVEHLSKQLGRDRVFYDEWYEAELVGLDGDLKLKRYYREQCEMVVPFFSEHYAKPWCRIEWHAIRAMLLQRRAEDAVVPVELDGTRIDGWEPVDFAIRRGGRTGIQIAEQILAAYRYRHPQNLPTSGSIRCNSRILFGSEIEFRSRRESLVREGLRTTTGLKHQRTGGWIVGQYEWAQEKAMADIFISYAQDDRSKAQLLAEAFERRGWSVWWDTRLQAGEIWDEVIERELNAARCIVVLWSKTSVGRHWVRVEANEGLQRRILVPALIENVQPPLAFRLIQAEPLLDWSGEPSHAGLNRLLAAISERLRTRPPPDDDIDAWCPEMVALPTGDFLMGSPEDDIRRDSNEGPQHRVTIGYPLAMGKYPVTVYEYHKFVDATASRQDDGMYVWTGSEWQEESSKNWRNPGFAQTDRHPVVGVSWRDAVAYCEWLGKETGKPYRLPSEAEWEYACRAGETTRFSFGDEIGQNANFGGNYIGGTTEVGSYPPNAWGLYDMHGNVSEWVEDIWHDSYKGAPTNGTAWTEDEKNQSSHVRILRGGSWYTSRSTLRSASRCGGVPSGRRSDRGFRVAQQA